MQKNREIKAIIFDMGGVTIKWSDKIVYKHIAEITGMKEDKIEKIANLYMKRFDAGKLTEREFWNIVAKRLHYEKGLKGNWLEKYGNHANQDEKVFNTIKKLKKSGYTIATITNVIKPHYRYNTKHHLYDVFDKTFASCQLKIRKPGLLIYIYAIDQLKIKPEECLFIDDRKENVLAAKKVGMQYIIFKNAAQLKKDLRLHGIKMRN
jgi:epoxide hydrolase-like predicted phosphatase